MSRPPLRPSVVVALVCLVLLGSGCQLRLAGDIDVRQDGSGFFAFAIALDEELTTLMEEAGVDLLRGLEGASEEAGWQIETDREGEGLEVRLGTAFDRPDELGRLVAELQSGLGPEDPQVLRDVSLEVDDDGAARFSGSAGLELPETAGAAGDGVSFDGDDLERLLTESEDELVRYDLRVTLPGAIASSDADRIEGRTATWELPVGTMDLVTAEASPPGSQIVPIAVATALVVAVITAGALLWRRRSSSEEELSPSA